MTSKKQTPADAGKKAAKGKSAKAAKAAPAASRPGGPPVGRQRGGVRRLVALPFGGPGKRGVLSLSSAANGSPLRPRRRLFSLVDGQRSTPRFGRDVGQRRRAGVRSGAGPEPRVAGEVVGVARLPL